MREMTDLERVRAAGDIAMRCALDVHDALKHVRYTAAWDGSRDEGRLVAEEGCRLALRAEGWLSSALDDLLGAVGTLGELAGRVSEAEGGRGDG